MRNIYKNDFQLANKKDGWMSVDVKRQFVHARFSHVPCISVNGQVTATDQHERTGISEINCFEYNQNVTDFFLYTTLYPW